MSDESNLVDAAPFEASNGEEFVISVKKVILTEEHSYWLYKIQAVHKSWGNMGFSVFATKQAFPNEELADQLAKTLALDAAKSKFEQVDSSGRSLTLPLFHEGWGII